MKRSWIPYIRERHLNKEAALPLLALPLIAAGKGLLAAGAAKAAVVGGAIAAKAAGAAIAASKTGAALLTAGKVAGHAMTGMAVYDAAKAVTGGSNQQDQDVSQTADVQNTGNSQVNTSDSAQAQQQQGANTEAVASNTSVPPSNTSTTPGNVSNV